MLQAPVSAGEDLVLTVEAALREMGRIIVIASLDTMDTTAAGVGYIFFCIYLDYLAKLDSMRIV